MGRCDQGQSRYDPGSYIKYRCSHNNRIQFMERGSYIKYRCSHNNRIQFMERGSPQIMSVVKLCSGWTVTSLPLYSDVDLLKRNENIYQVYAMKSAEDIYKILTSYKANYVIIEEAVCSEMGPARGCRVKDLLDVANGHVVYDQGDMYAFSKHGRFCHEIKLNLSPYVNYFTRVFWNRSYHVYKVNTVISFQY
ncbi:UNVERIFIED_CONTAM: hypothetical protein FKN15_077999 [Acipenser sinensis]